ncbi:Beta-lactamase superfamily domain containing protein, putative [Trypanosoma equiperdum]|uniref:Metallo-beta-lactamase domain-containing protein n=2 Tax=Trypanozoon TaxID=39700 RepID=Q57YY5_TRYB2|nr:hypothetical protein, conserved [Trypanosoma brucei brucei TREU927]AAX79647.1 hypothetical protein, conserved [Trypanosoma brucei]AAZ13093.1 hypothetical protein, conserved [Trypanosoma brucei brucei TREU927]SCU66130.1 Beta-lactamase superfamily domain containing protein, putative [Trypanosoma equiperdum]
MKGGVGRSTAAPQMEFVRAVIVGSGSSSSTPMLSCALSGSPCPNCEEALRCSGSKNHRLNPSFLIQLYHPTDRTVHNILIDCGKTFRESALKVFPSFLVRDFSAVLLTHDHADASYGIDDLREFSRKDVPIGVYADETTLAAMRGVYPYLFAEDMRSRGAGEPAKKEVKKNKFVATINWELFTRVERMDVVFSPRPKGVTTGNEGDIADGCETGAPAVWSFVPVGVPHGENYRANAFLVPMHDKSESPRLLLYVSDISELEDRFFTDLARSKVLLGVDPAVPIEVLVLDMLSRRPYVAHLHVEASIAAAKRINAAKTYYVGMSHRINYDEMMQELQQLGLGATMEMGYDGCVVSVGDSGLQHLSGRL